MTGQKEVGFLVAALDPYRNEEVQLVLALARVQDLKRQLRLSSIVATALHLLLARKVLLTECPVFKGLRRDLHCVSDPQWYSADRAHVYAVDAPYAYAADGSEIDKPDHALFGVTVRFWDTVHGQPSYVDESSREEFQPRGVVEYWEWLIRDPNDHHLPEDHGTRYDERVR